MKKRIVIIGGGFAGYNLAKELNKDSQFQITLIDKNNYNYFPPLIYQVATGFLSPTSIIYPFRKLLRRYKNVTFRLGKLLEIMPSTNEVRLSNGTVSYDYLVIATGTVSNYFGIRNIKKYAVFMKTIDDAINLRNNFLSQLENASLLNTSEEIAEELNLVIVGGGPTGVELAGVFAEMKKTFLPVEYPNLKGEENFQTIHLLDGGPTLLSPMSEKSQKYTYEELKKLNVNIILNAQVIDYDGQFVYLKDGTSIKAKNMIWTAGVTGVIFRGLQEQDYGRGKRILVDEHNKLIHYSNIFAIGDICLQTTDEKLPHGHPQQAQVAIQQGVNLAKNLIRIRKNESLEPFEYLDKGSMAIIGRNKAVADLPKNIHFNGFFAWFLWIFVHVMSLVNTTNKLRTLANWVKSYFNQDSSLRVLIRPKKERSI